MYVLEITPQGCGETFAEFGIPTKDISLLIKSPEKISLVVFTGGDDVWPGLYGESVYYKTHFNRKRDDYESQMLEMAFHIPKVGICRGAQFLCVKAGGRLVQDISGHLGSHQLRINDGRVITCTSSHHQMQLPPRDAIPLAWSNRKLSNRYVDGNGHNIKVDREHEVVYYPNINAVGIQHHPEWVWEGHECAKYAREVVREYLFNQENRQIDMV